jgi:hypothetical protein
MSYEPEPREGERNARKQLSSEAGDSGGDLEKSDDGRLPLALGNGKRESGCGEGDGGALKRG